MPRTAGITPAPPATDLFRMGQYVSYGQENAPEPEIELAASREVLSSIQTWPNKFLVPVAYVFGFIYAVWRANIYALVPNAVVIVPLVFALSMACVYWYQGRLKKVTLDGAELIISDYFREIHVPLTKISEVRGSRMSKMHYIKVQFDPALGFGGSIIFMPKWRFVWPFQEHPCAQELRERIESARYFSPRRYTPSSAKPW